MKRATTGVWLLICLVLAGCSSLHQSSKMDAYEPSLLMQHPSVQVPLINGGNLQWRVSAIVNGQSGIFILDTGADFTILTPQFAKRLGLYSDALKGRFAGSQSIDRKVKYAPINSFKLGTVKYFNFYAAILDLDHINQAMHSDVAGIIGNNLLNQTAYSIDWKKNTLTLDSRRIDPPADAIPISIRNNRIYCLAQINGKEVPFALDTGAYRCLLSNEELAHLGIPEKKKSLVEMPQIDIAEARQLKQTLIKVDEFKFGKISRKDYPMLIWDHNVLGMDLLESYILTVDARRNWLLLSEQSSPLASLPQ
jgi:predicted aspartyl protease